MIQFHDNLYSLELIQYLSMANIFYKVITICSSTLWQRKILYNWIDTFIDEITYSGGKLTSTCIITLDYGC